MRRLTLIAACIVVVFLSSCNKTGPKTAPLLSVPVEKIEATADQKERREKSETYCKAHNIPIYSNPTSLFVSSEEETTIRTHDAVVDRALALCYIGLKSEGLEQKYLDQMDMNFGISSKLSPEEMKYAKAVTPLQQQITDANWRYESLHVMLWALGFIDSLSYPDQMCVVANDVKIIRDLTEQEFRKKAKLRSKQEILDQADLILRISWACEDARINGKSAPGNLNAEVVMERHYSLNWLINYMDENWDDVTTDT